MNAVCEVRLDGLKEEVTSETRLSTDLGMDSLDYVNLMLEIEDNIEKADFFPPEADEIPDEITVGELIDRIDGWLTKISTE